MPASGFWREVAPVSITLALTPDEWRAVARALRDRLTFLREMIVFKLSIAKGGILG